MDTNGLDSDNEAGPLGQIPVVSLADLPMMRKSEEPLPIRELPRLSVRRSASSYWMAGWYWAGSITLVAFIVCINVPEARTQLASQGPLTWTLTLSFLLIMIVSAAATAARDLRRIRRG
jgi:hypothetical protein